MRRVPRLALASFFLGALTLLLSACNPFGLGPDELPDSLSDGDRERIGEVVRNFFAGVDAYNPQLAGEVMLTPGEVGIEEFARMVFRIGVLQSAELAFNFRAIEAATVDSDAGVVRATANTELGRVQVALVRREGNWRVARVPDVSIPEEFDPFPKTWEVTNSYTSTDGQTFVIIGEFTNVGQETWLVLSTPGSMLSAEGAVLRAEPSSVLARPFVEPGGTLPFRVDFRIPDGTTFDASGFEPLLNVRRARGSDREILATALEIEPDQAQGGDSVSLTVSNGEESRRTAWVVGLARDARGTLISLFQDGPVEVAGQLDSTIETSPVDPPVLDRLAVVEFEIWGSAPQ
ncbi:MAG: hypothetical protein R3C39_04150 [Dehalococcoidia bacterium]